MWSNPFQITFTLSIQPFVPSFRFGGVRSDVGIKMNNFFTGIFTCSLDSYSLMFSSNPDDKFEIEIDMKRKI